LLKIFQLLSASALRLLSRHSGLSPTSSQNPTLASGLLIFAKAYVNRHKLSFDPAITYRAEYVIVDIVLGITLDVADKRACWRPLNGDMVSLFNIL
jgi:hypothetical protein